MTKVNKLLKVGKSPVYFQLEAISKNSHFSKYVWYLSYFYVLSYLYEFFSVNTMCVNKREVTVVWSRFYIRNLVVNLYFKTFFFKSIKRKCF